MDTKSIKNIIQDALNKSQVEVIDTTGGGDHFSVVVISDIFENMNLVNRHKLIYNALNKFLNKEIHALQLKTLTKKEFNHE